MRSPITITSLLLAALTCAQPCSIDRNERTTDTGEWVVMARAFTMDFEGGVVSEVAIGRMDSTFVLTIHLTGAIFKGARLNAGDSLIVVFDDGANVFIPAFNTDSARAMLNLPGSYAISCQYLMMGDGMRLFAERLLKGLRFQLGGPSWDGVIDSEYDKKRLKRSAQCVLEAPKP